MEHGGLCTRIEFDEATTIEINDLLPDEARGRTCWFTYNGAEITSCTTGYFGAILYEDSEGNVSSQLCETSMEMDEEWNRIEHIHDHDMEVA